MSSIPASPSISPSAPQPLFSFQPRTHGLSAVGLPEQTSTKFGAIGPTAIAQFIGDTSGVLVPKLPTVRTRIQLFEEVVLELLEDGAFYFAIPLAGPLLAKATHALAGKTPGFDAQHLGYSIAALEKKGIQTSSKLIGAKFGAVMGAVAIACGLEYLVQFSKNMLTDKLFKTKNFTAVAGLEASNALHSDGKDDPTLKAKRRIKQVGAIMATLVGASLLAPLAIRNGGFLESAARKFLKFFDFNGSVNAKNALVNEFDLSKALMISMILTGVVSYLDAARSWLERKEIASRLVMVVPYLVFGKELAGNALAWLFQRKKLGEGADAFRIQDKISFLDKTPFWEKAKQALTTPDPKVFLDFNLVKGNIVDEVEKLALSPELKDNILRQHHGIEFGKYALSALVMGIGLNLLTYYQTRQRYKRKQAEALQHPTLQEQPPQAFQKPTRPWTPSFPATPSSSPTLPAGVSRFTNQLPISTQFTGLNTASRPINPFTTVA